VRRSSDNRALAGVASALGEALGVSTAAARVAFVALSFAGGAGLAAYIILWLVLPGQASEQAIVHRAIGDRRTLQLVLASATVLAAVMVAAEVLGAGALLGVVSPGAVCLAGLVAVWRHADADDKAAVQRVAGQLSGNPAGASTRRLFSSGARLLVGVLLVAGGTSAFLDPKHLSGADLRALLATVVVLLGFAVVFAPWWLRLGRELASERRERARAQERAEMAAHLHDSVLQTLALIQRSAGDPQQVKRLARAQERQLRAWLFDGAPAGPLVAGDAVSISEALMSVQRDVEADHGVSVEVVTVGDAPLDDRLRALVAAAREATVNAAKWSRAELVSVYAEVEPDAVSVFVRDRGQGFDPSGVGADRKGISESICARVSRCGGTAQVRSSPGEGTEVALHVPRRSPS
jgi:signal transduction histidine kinase